MKWSSFIVSIAGVALSTFSVSFLAHYLSGQIFSFVVPDPGIRPVQQDTPGDWAVTYMPGDAFPMDPQKLVEGWSAKSIPEQASPALPVRLRIPTINVDATVEYVGLTPDGAMDIPKSPDDAGWFEPGTRPGEEGSAVMAGHYGQKDGKVSAFDDLHKLRPGDTVYVEDGSGSVTSFVVRRSRRYDPNADASEVFGSHDGKSHLNLITCEGKWDDALNGYPTRLVVFTDKEAE